MNDGMMMVYRWNRVVVVQKKKQVGFSACFLRLILVVVVGF
jgi:hypothetical protein